MPACRAAARELEELEGALVQLGECDPPPQLVSGVMERVRADSAPCQGRPALETPCLPGALGMAACAAPCASACFPKWRVSPPAAEQHRRRPCQRLGVPGRFPPLPLPVPMLPAGSPPSTEVRSSNAGRPEAEDTAPMEAESPASIAPFPCRNRGAGAPGGLLRPCPALSGSPGRTADQSPGRLLLFSTIPEELEDRDWQETDGFRWTALEAEGDPPLLDALTAQAAALWGRAGAEGPAVALVYP